MMEVKFSRENIEFKNDKGSHRLYWRNSLAYEFEKRKRVMIIVAFLLLILIADMAFLGHYYCSNPQKFWKEGKEVIYRDKDFIVLKETKISFVLTPKDGNPWISISSIEEELEKAQKTFPNARIPTLEEVHKIQYYHKRINIWYEDNNGIHIGHVSASDSGKATFYYVIEVKK